jgi:hypothetical protein
MEDIFYEMTCKRTFEMIGIAKTHKTAIITKAEEIPLVFSIT